MTYDNLECEFSGYASIARIVSEIDEEMVTPADIQGGIEAVSSALSTLQKAREVAKRTQNTEISEIITDLRSKIVETKNLLIDIKAEVVELKEKNLALENQLKALESSRSKQTLQKNKNGLFYGVDDERYLHPFCPACWLGNEPKRSLLVKTHNRQVSGTSDIYDYRCTVCSWSDSIQEGGFFMKVTYPSSKSQPS